MKTIFVLLMWCLLPVCFGGVKEDRIREARLRKDGNWKEALALNEGLLRSVSDEKSGVDLQDAMMCAQKLPTGGLMDGLFEIVDEKHLENTGVLLVAGKFCETMPHDGMIVGGEFVRGRRRWEQGAVYANAIVRDRVRGLSYFERGLNLEKRVAERLALLSGMDSLLQKDRRGNQSWRLQVLTDLAEVPDFDEGYRAYRSGTGGAPVDEKGDPVFYEIPESWEEAKNDGERWRWTMAERVRLDKNQKNPLLQRWADFLRQQFGVQTLSSYGFYRSFGRGWGDDVEENQNGVMQLHTLKDGETLCRLATGVKRMMLPEGQSFMAIYRKLYEGGSLGAGDQMVRIYLDRRQYVKGRELLEEIMVKGETEQRRALLKSIKGNWGKFDLVNRSFVVGEEPKVGMVYRNAAEVTVTAFEVDVDGLNWDRWNYLESNPVQLDYHRVHFSRLTQKLLSGHHNQFVGKKAGERKYELEPRKNHWDVRGDFAVPVKKAGAYLVKAEMKGSDPFYTMVWVEDFVLVKKVTKEGLLAFVTDARTGEPLAGATVDLFGYDSVRLEKPKLKRKMNVVTKRRTVKTGDDGQVLMKDLDNGYQWFAKVSKGGKMLWSDKVRGYGYRVDYQTHEKVGAFGMTSQPVYRPGKTVQGKFWVRKAKYDLGEKSEFAGKGYVLKVSDPKGDQVGKDWSGVVDQFGGVAFETEIEEGAILGTYRVALKVEGAWVGNLAFRVEEFKKPEYEVEVEAPKEGVVLGEKFEATVKATYYHGAPVTKARVKVKVTRHDYAKVWYPWGRWDWLYGGGYGWFDVERPWYPGWRFWGCRCPLPFWWGGGWSQPELVFEREMEITADGTVKVLVDTELAKLMHGDGDHRYQISAEVVDASRRTIFGSGSVLATRDPYRVTVWLDRGYARVGEKVTAQIAARTLDGKIVEAEGKAILYQVTYSKEGEPKEKQVEEWEVAKHPEGIAKIEFAAKEGGQYRLVAKLKDDKGRAVSGAVLFTLRGDDSEKGDYRYNALELITDQRTYAVGDRVQLLVNTARANSTVLVFVRGSEERYLLKMKGKSEVLEIPVKGGDMPNFFVEAVTVSDAAVHTLVREVIVPPEKRVLDIAVLPDREKYKAGAEGKVKVRVTGSDGEPVQGEVVLAIYDKALEYVSGGSNAGNIKEFFWKWRRRFYGGFGYSQRETARNQVKKGREAMSFLGAFGQSLADDSVAMRKGFDKRAEGDSSRAGGGLFRLNEVKKVKSNSKMAGFDDSSVEGFGDGWGGGHGGNGAAEPELVVRRDFADSIKWEGKVELDEDGVGVVEVAYPDNLTTWKVKAWAMAHGTRVGEGEAEVITSKDLIVRLQAPRFFMEKDEVVLSAVVHNYHEISQDVRVLLELEGGTLVTEDELEQEVSLGASGGEERVDWRVKVEREGQALVRMKVIAKNDADAMEMTFPVHVHGIEKQFAWSRVIAPGEEEAEIVIKVPEERRPEESSLQVNFSPSIAGAVVDALPYLVEYPHGCTEQTLNRFVPTVITQKLLKEMGIDLEEVRNKRVNFNPQELGDSKERAKRWKQWKRNPVFDEKEVNRMVRKGVDRLVEMQLSSGGWGWFSGYGESASAHTTAVVVHGLTIAKANGARVPAERLKLGLDWLRRYESVEAEKIRMWKKREKKTKRRADERDAFVRLVLAENGIKNAEMQGFLFRDKNDLGVYGKCLLGMSLHLDKNGKRRDEVIRNIEQFLVYDEENQSAYLKMGNGGYWWYWYGSEFEAHAWYLKLKSATAPQSKEARGVVKYLVNNRRHGTYWKSTRDTAYCIEAIADYMRASGEDAPECEVEVLYDGQVMKTVKVTKENLFHFDSKMSLGGDVLSGGEHVVTIRRKGKGALYANAYLKVFTKEEFIEKTGLEVKVERQFYKLVRDESKTVVAGDRGQLVEQQEDRYTRIPLKSGDALKSGDMVEVELVIESKNDYEYLLFQDWKAAGMEAEKVRSGYLLDAGLRAYMEVKDEKVSFYVQNLSQGKHSLSYRLRAEIPGRFSALPAMGEAMYAPELRANSDEMKVEIGE